MHNGDCRELAKHLQEQNGGEGQVVGVFPEIGGTEPRALYPVRLRPGWINPPNTVPDGFANAGRPWWSAHWVYENDGMIQDPAHLSYPVPWSEYGETVFPGQSLFRVPE